MHTSWQTARIKDGACGYFLQRSAAEGSQSNPCGSCSHDQGYQEKHARQQEEREKQQNGHPAGYGTAETICAGSRYPSSSRQATTADPPTEGCHVLGSKHSVKLGDHLMTIDTDGRAPRGGTYSVMYAREYQAYIKQNPSSVSAHLDTFVHNCIISQNFQRCSFVMLFHDLMIFGKKLL